MPTNLSTRAERLDGVEILRAAGEVDLSTAARLGRALEQAGAVVPGAPLIADLTEVEFIDSAGARVLALADRNAAARGAELLIVPSEFVSRVLEVSGLVSALQVYAELSTAMETARALATDRTVGGAPPAAG